MDVAAYLERIDFSGDSEPGLANLDALVQAHQQTVPFENIDIVRLHRPIVLETDRHYAKIVEERRGGFCYELNGLFGALLSELGYAVSMGYGVWPADGDRWTEPFEHIVLVVSLPETATPALVDVGFGAESPVVAVPLIDGQERTVGGRAVAAYRAVAIPGQPNFWRIEARHQGGDWTRIYEIDVTPRTIDDFVARCNELQFSPESHFTQRLICSRPTENGRVTLGGGSFILTQNDERTERPIVNLDDELTLLRAWFGIEIDPQVYGER